MTQTIRVIFSISLTLLYESAIQTCQLVDLATTSPGFNGLEASMNFGKAPFVLIGLLLLTSSCGQVTNSYDNDSLSCGSGQEKQSEFFTVTGADGRKLTAADISLISFNDKHAQIPPVSRNGCIKKPQAGRYLIKAKEKDWAVIFDANTVAPRESVQMLDFTGQSLAIQCSESERWTVGGSFSIQTLVKSTLENTLAEAFPISVELKKSDVTLKEFKSVGLRDLGLLQPFNEIVADGDYELLVTMKNLLKEGRDTVTNCRLRLDRTAPLVSFSVNSSLNLPTLSIQNTESFAIVNPSENIEFISKDSDIKEVRYCLKELDDNFTPDDVEKRLGWKNDTQSTSCDSLLVNSTTLGSPLPIENRAGIWSIRYQAVDAFGNISAPKSTLFIYFSKDNLEIIKNLAISDTPLFVLQNKSSQAAASALQAESMRIKLRTKYERDLIKDHTRAGVITAFDQPGIAIRVDKSDRRVTSVAITRDGKFALSGSFVDNIIQIWNIENRSMLTSLTTQDPVEAITVSPDGKTIYAGLSSGNIEVIDMDSKDSVMIKSHDREVSHLTLSSDGKALISGSTDGSLKIWETSSLKLLSSMKDHTAPIVAIVINHEGSRIFSASNDGRIVMWDLKLGQKIRDIESGFNSVNALTLSNDEKRLAIASQRKIKVVKTDDNFSSFLSIDTQLIGEIVQLSFRPDGRTLISSMNTSTIQFWNMTWGFEEKKIIDTGSLISSMAMSPDGKRIVTGSMNSSLTIWETEMGFTPQVPIKGADSSTIQSLALSSDERFVVSLSSRSKSLDIHLIKEPGEPAIKLAASEDTLTTVGISPINEIAAGTDKGTIIIWDTHQPDAKPSRILTGHTSPVKTLAFMAKGSKLVSGSDQTLVIHDFATGEILKSSPLTSSIEALAASSSGTFVSAQTNGEIDLWDMETLQHLGKLKDPVGLLLSIDITADGKRIVTGASNGVVRFWDTRTGTSVAQQSGFGEKIKYVRWLPSEQAAISGSVDQTLRIWDAATGRNISTWVGHVSGVNAMALNKEANLAVVGGDGFRAESINVWDLSLDLITSRLCAVGNVGNFEVCHTFQ